MIYGINPGSTCCTSDPIKKGTKGDEEEVEVRGGTVSEYGKSAVEVSETGGDILPGVEYAGGK